MLNIFLFRGWGGGEEELERKESVKFLNGMCPEPPFPRLSPPRITSLWLSACTDIISRRYGRWHCAHPGKGLLRPSGPVSWSIYFTGHPGPTGVTGLSVERDTSREIVHSWRAQFTGCALHIRALGNFFFPTISNALKFKGEKKSHRDLFVGSDSLSRLDL